MEHKRAFRVQTTGVNLKTVTIFGRTQPTISSGAWVKIKLIRIKPNRISIVIGRQGRREYVGGRGKSPVLAI